MNIHCPNTRALVIPRGRMIELERIAIERGASVISLMDDVADGMATALGDIYGRERLCVVYAGKGHNGGDALATARLLINRLNWRICVRLAAQPDDLAPLTRSHLDALGVAPAESCEEVRVFLRKHFSQKKRPPILLDGLLGIGARGELREPAAALVEEICVLRAEGTEVVALDLPSGLNPETGNPGKPCVVADTTLTVAYGKSCLVADSAVDHVGRIVVIGCPAISAAEQETPGEVPRAFLLVPAEIKRWLPPRKHSWHKGNAGRVTIVAGSTGMHGAAALCATAAVRAGAGLVTLFCNDDVYPIVAACCAPEVMVRPVSNFSDVIVPERTDVVALGPGIGRAHFPELLSLLRSLSVPCVIDAGGLEALGMQPGFACRGEDVLTPHEGELARLLPRDCRTRWQWATDAAKMSGGTVLLKGARSIVASAEDDDVWFNTTGNSGMATGGMGDVLTGVIAALMGAGMTGRKAAGLGAWLCGCAADIAITHGNQTKESLTASDVIAFLGKAFMRLREPVSC